MKYANVTLGRVEAVWNKLGGEEAIERFLRGELVICEVHAPTTTPRKFKTWKTVKLGTHKSAEDLSKALTDSGFRIGNYPAQILKETAIAETETEIELVLVTVAKLGFDKATRRDAIYYRAKKLGLDLVPAEVGPQLRLAYLNQPMGELLIMAMEPIAGFDGVLNVFRVWHSGGSQLLDTGYGDLDQVWFPSDRWVFARRKQN